MVTARAKGKGTSPRQDDDTDGGIFTGITESLTQLLNGFRSESVSDAGTIDGEFGNAFADFWPIINNFSGVRGVLHSFTDSLVNLDKVLQTGLYVGVNGILTFNRDSQLAEVYQAMPLERIVLETDAPYLAPKPYRGKVDQPAYIRPIAEYLAEQRNLSISKVARQTTANAMQVFPALA